MKWIRLNFSKTIIVLFEFSRLQEKSWGIVQVSVQPMSAMPFLWCGGNRHLTLIGRRKQNTSK